MTLDRFHAQYGVGRLGAGWSPLVELEGVPGYLEIASTIGGDWVCDGLYRLLDRRLSTAGVELIATGFPPLAARAVPFGVDWLGRVTAVDRARWPNLLLIEPGSGEVFDIDDSLEAFFDVDLVEDPETYLEAELHAAWRASGGRDPQGAECVGFKVPLFLGGSGDVSNLELVDIEVYWSLTGQLRARTHGLPPGSAIGGVSIDD